MLDALLPRISKLVLRPPLLETAASTALRIDALRSSMGVSRSGMATLRSRSRSGGGVVCWIGGGATAAAAAAALPFLAGGARFAGSAAGRLAGTVRAGAAGRAGATGLEDKS